MWRSFLGWGRLGVDVAAAAHQRGGRGEQGQAGGDAEHDHEAVVERRRDQPREELRAGQDVLVRGLLKPISTLRRPLESVDLNTREPALAAYERSDVAVVPAAGVIGEAMVALVLAQSFLEKFGGDSLGETRRNYQGYLEQLKSY